MNSGEQEAWMAGYLAGLREAERLHAWPTRQGREERIRAELAEGQMIASEMAIEMGRPAGYRYRGGAVGWESGLPAGSACDWLRSRSA